MPHPRTLMLDFGITFRKTGKVQTFVTESYSGMFASVTLSRTCDGIG